MKKEYFVGIGLLCILLFYAMMNILILGGLQFQMLLFEITIGIFLTTVVTGFLGTKLAGLHQYSMEQIFTSVAIVHIIAILGFWMVMIVTSTRFVGDISPLTGHLVFLISIVIQLAIVIPYRTQRWLQIGTGIYLIVYLLFALWQYVPFGILGLLLFYVVLYNISVMSYGVLQYMTRLKDKQQEIEME